MSAVWLEGQFNDEQRQADQFFVNTDGEAFNNRQALFVAWFVREAPELKHDVDHTLVWRTPVEALSRLRHPSHAWAVALWLRARAAQA